MFGPPRFSKRRDYESVFPPLPISRTSKKTQESKDESSDSAARGFLLADLDASELKKVEDSKAENGEIEIVCNGIRYKGRPVEEVALPQLVCEECEKILSSVKCEQCDQVFCSSCYVLCHERLEGGTVLHPHEVEKMVRPIRIGDTSSVVIDNSFVLPDYNLYESDMNKIRPLDIPNSLALSGYAECAATAPRKGLKYQRGDVVLYYHSAMKCEVYGMIESEWDFRNGDSAPSLIRSGGDGLACYIVRCLGVTTPDVLKKLENSKESVSADDDDDENERQSRQSSSKNLPMLEGIECMSLTSERVLANRIDKRLNRAKYYRDCGPKHHLNPPIPRGFGGADADDESLAGAVDVDSDCDSAGDPKVKCSGHSELLASSKNDTEQLSFLRSTRPPTAEELRAKSLPHPIASRRTIDGVVAAYSYVAEVEATLNHENYNIALEAPLIQRRNMISVQSEDSLITPKDRMRLQELRKNEDVRRILTKRVAAMCSNWLLWAFHIWLSGTIKARKIISFRCAVLIQSMVRRWLAQRRMQECIHISNAEARQRWLRVHQKFNYCTPDTPGAVTMDKKIFFRNIRDINAYGKELRIATTKFFNVAEKKRTLLLTESFHKWNMMTCEYRENCLRISHISPHYADKGKMIEGEDRKKLVERTRRVHRDLQSRGHHLIAHELTHVDADPSDDSRLHLNSLPMAMSRHCEDSDIAPPPWHPSVGFMTQKLPELPVLPRLVNDHKSNNPASVTDKQKYNSFRSAIEGPTDYSCWIIPGRLAMGRIPTGKARKKGPVDSVIHTHIDSVSQILLAGLNSFVSLVTDDEEQESIRNDSSLALDPNTMMKDRIQHCQKAVYFSLKEDVLMLSQMIEEKNIQLEDYSHIEDVSHLSVTSEKRRKAEKMKKEKNRLRAKKLILCNEVDKVKEAVKAFPPKVDWISYAMEHNSVPSLDCVIPILWKIEQKLWEGENIYVYSKDGNGRSGLICGCLLGRLYGLSHSETLLRMQTYFDCQRSQLDRVVSSNCPQMRRQQELVSRILMITNRTYQGISHRAGTDPDSYNVEIEHVQRGFHIESNKKVRRSPPEGKQQRKTYLDLHVSSPLFERQQILPSVTLRHTQNTADIGDIDQQVYSASSLGNRSLTLIRPVPKSRPTICDSPIKHRYSNG